MLLPATLRTPVRALLTLLVVASLTQVPAPAAAKTSKPTLQVKKSSSTTYTLHGRTPNNASTVHVQRWTGKRWATIKKAKARKHRFKTRITVRTTTTVRVRAAKKNSPRRTLRAPAARRTTAPAPRPPATTPAPPPPGEPSTDECGVRPARADGTLWSCTFVDDFTGTTLDRSKWVPQTLFATGTPEAKACYQDAESNISVSGGHLHLTLRAEEQPITCALDGTATGHSAGMVTTFGTFSQKFGRFEARIKTSRSQTPGLHEAFWLWPDAREADTSTWPASGEIDIVETYSSHPELAIPFLHYTHDDNGGPIPGVNTAWDCRAERGVFNTYRLDWTATGLEIYVNGTLCLRNTSADPAFANKYIVALTQAAGTVGNELTPSTPVPATMTVDYVKVWQ